MRLGTADIHALVGTPAHMHEYIGIGLLVMAGSFLVIVGQPR